MQEFSDLVARRVGGTVTAFAPRSPKLKTAMTQMKIHSGLFQAIAMRMQRPFLSVWEKCVSAGAREIEQMRASGPRCPQCGALLISRRVGFGRDAGKEFWDCSNIPKCFLSLTADAVTFPEGSTRAAAA